MVLPQGFPGEALDFLQNLDRIAIDRQVSRGGKRTALFHNYFLPGFQRQVLAKCSVSRGQHNLRPGVFAGGHHPGGHADLDSGIQSNLNKDGLAFLADARVGVVVVAGRAHIRVNLRFENQLQTPVGHDPNLL